MYRHHWPHTYHHVEHTNEEWSIGALILAAVIITLAGIAILFTGRSNVAGFALFLSGVLIGGYSAIRAGHVRH